MTPAENKALIADLYDDVFRRWNTARIDEAFAADFHDHLLNRPGPDAGPGGPASVHALYDALRAAFPDLEFQVHDMIAEGDRVVVRWSWTCTHLGEFRGLAPTGRKETVEGTAIYRLEAGLIAERWVSTNLDALIAQLSAP